MCQILVEFFQQLHWFISCDKKLFDYICCQPFIVVFNRYISRTFGMTLQLAHILGDMHNNERRASGSLEVKDEPYIYIADSYAYL